MSLKRIPAIHGSIHCIASYGWLPMLLPDLRSFHFGLKASQSPEKILTETWLFPLEPMVVIPITLLLRSSVPCPIDFLTVASMTSLAPPALPRNSGASSGSSTKIANQRSGAWRKGGNCGDAGEGLVVVGSLQRGWGRGGTHGSRWG
jgi:hypothetical protein